MIKSLRFWGDAFGLTRTQDREIRVTEFARMLLDPHGGLESVPGNPRRAVEIALDVDCPRRSRRVGSGIP